MKEFLTLRCNCTLWSYIWEPAAAEAHPGSCELAAAEAGALEACSSRPKRQAQIQDRKLLKRKHILEQQCYILQIRGLK